MPFHNLFSQRFAVGIIAIVVGIVMLAGTSSALDHPASGKRRPSPALLKMHDDFVLAFIDSEGFGQTRLPAMSRVLHSRVGKTGLWVAHLELIGIAKHITPRVFSSEMSIFHRPDGKEPPLLRAPDRAMTAQEQQALRDLDAGQTLIVEPEGKGLRVIGPIRAGDECLGCHQDKRAGDMLGAFVYALQPVPKQ